MKMRRHRTRGVVLTFLSCLFVTSTGWSAARVGGCPVFPADNPWNTDVSAARVDPDSNDIISRFKPTWTLKLFTVKPYNIVNAAQPKVPVHYIAYGRTSDPGPMPIPRDAAFMRRRSGTSPFAGMKHLTDNHLMVVDVDACRLYELWSVTGANPDGSWNAGSGAIYDLRSNEERPARAASATASGLPVFPGLLRPDEVRSGAVEHALSVTTTYTRPGYVSPATSYQRQFGRGPDWDNPHNPVMGMRLRLRRDYDVSALGPQARVIATALKRYGAIVTDGSSGSGTLAGPPDPFWNNRDLIGLKSIPADAFEVLRAGEIRR